MGAGIVRSFARARVPLLVWDIDSSRAAELAGLRGVAVAEPAEMAGSCDLVIFVVPSAKEVAQHLRGKAGILANGRRGTVICDFTTSDPASSRKLAALAARKGMAYLDAGMSGGAAGAETGNLILMVGGERRAFERIRGRLGPITRRVFHLGPSGTGHTLKLIHNLVTHAAFLATCEGCRMAEKAGIRLEDVIGVFNVSNARTYASEVRFPRHILSRKWDARSRVFNLLKDLSMAVRLGNRLGADASCARLTRDFLERAAALGMLENDYSLLYRDFDRIVRSRSRRGIRL